MSEKNRNSPAPFTGDVRFDSAGDPIGGYLAVAAGDAPAPGLVPVSYTHLTLPTICSV